MQIWHEADQHKGNLLIVLNKFELARVYQCFICGAVLDMVQGA